MDVRNVIHDFIILCVIPVILAIHIFYSILTFLFNYTYICAVCAFTSFICAAAQHLNYPLEIEAGLSYLIPSDLIFSVPHTLEKEILFDLNEAFLVT